LGALFASIEGSESMKVCIVGVGAVGGTIGFNLAKAGCEVSGIARGATLEALREKGLRFTEGGSVESVKINATDDPRDLGPQNIVIISVKAPSLAKAVAGIGPLLGPETIVLPAMNGVPWWFFQDFGGPLIGRVLESTDPSGKIAAAIPPMSIIGCVVHLGASCPEPGFVSALPRRALIVGEPSGRKTRRLLDLADRLRSAGFEVNPTDSIQREVWYKLWGNMTMNPLSALTGATMDRILGDPLVADFCRAVMTEAKNIGAKIGCPIEQSVDDRFAITRKLGAFKTSMLQDVEARRPVELDSILASAVEIGDLVGGETKNMKTLLGLARLHARTLGLYPST
jgi:2-dehydropantoate 2-reductase